MIASGVWPTQRYDLVAPVTLIWVLARRQMGLPHGSARSVILAATYVVVLFSVIVQAGTISGCWDD
ncbi:hypothetical protein ABC347_11730 [Sphingomonas sp. 1P06PA]|uniref:hypothetical protein n=1 Tax=Sphingomonas sp. 1P06PA TaxID=554121 RepID=UPI0039A59337